MASRTNSRNVLVVDVGGTSVKSLPPGRIRLRKFPPGPKLKPEPMLFEVNQIARDWCRLGTQAWSSGVDRPWNCITSEALGSV